MFFLPDAGKGTPEVAVLDVNGQRSNQVKVRPISQDVWRCEYTAAQLGLHSVNVFFAGKPVPGSPFGVKVSPGLFSLSQVYIEANRLWLPFSCKVYPRWYTSHANFWLFCF